MKLFFDIMQKLPINVMKTVALGNIEWLSHDGDGEILKKFVTCPFKTYIE
jgi:hypothetical protein